MKTTKKAISVVLVVAMLLTSLSVGFMSFAAATDAQYNTLIAALKNDAVKDAQFTSVGGSASSGYTSSITDSDGRISAAVEAWWAVFQNEAYIANNADQAHSTKANINATKVTTTINSNLSAKMGSDFTAYNVQSFIDNLVGKARYEGSVLEETNPGVGSVTLTITNSNALSGYESIAAIPDPATLNTVYTINHRQGNYQTTSGSGCNKKTINHNFVAFRNSTANTFSKTTSTQSTTSLKNAYNTIVANEAYFTTFAALVDGFTLEQLSAAKTAIQGAYNTINNTYGASVYAEYVAADYDCVTALANLASAIDAKALVPTVERIEAICATDYSEFTSTDMLTLYNELVAKLEVYDSASLDTRNFFATEYGFDRAAAGEYAAALLKAYELKKLAELKVVYDAAIAAYNLLVDSQVAGNPAEISSEQISAYIGEISGYITALGTFNAENVAEVFGATYIEEQLVPCKAKLEELAEVADYNDAVLSKYAYFTSTVYSAIDLDASSKELLGALQSYEGWLGEVAALRESIEEAIGADDTARLFGALIDAMNRKFDEQYAALYARLASDINTAYDIYTAVYGQEVTSVTVGNFGTLKRAIGNINSAAFDFFSAEGSSTPVAPELVEKYNILKACVFTEYEAFVASGGFDKFESIKEDIVRKENESEKIRKGDFTVDDEMSDALVALIDAVLASDDFSNLIGKEDGLDIAGLLHGLLQGKIYSNALINTIMQFLYPLVAKEFAKVWADLPKTVQADNPIGSGKLDVTLSLQKIEEAMASIHFPIFPTLLAKELEDSYPQVAEVLAKGTTKAVYHKDTDVMDNPWEDAAICTEDGKLNLDWGIDAIEDPDAKKEAFLDAAQAALTGLEPILLALLSNKTINGTHNDNCNEIAKDGQPGHGKVGTGKTSIKVIFNINVTVDPINLFLNVAGNPGYNNVIVPLLEALGLNPEYIPDGNTFTSTKEVVRDGLIAPIAALIDQLGAAPVGFIAKALPNLAYAVEAGRIVPALRLLKTDITYHADAHYSAVAGLAAGDIPNALSDGPITINVGEMLNLEDLGLDLSSLNGLLDTILGLINKDGPALVLPPIDGGKLASMGELTWKDTKRAECAYDNLGNTGNAAYIDAYEGDVLIAVVKYFLKAIAGDPTLLDTIVGLVGSLKAKEPVEGEEPVEAKPFELPAVVLEILNKIAYEPDDAIAAIFELINPKDYPGARDYEEYEGGYSESDVAALAEEYGVTIEEVQAYIDANTGVKYSSKWTEDMAQYVVDHIDVVVDDILDLLGVEINGVKYDSLSSLVDFVKNEYITAETLNKLVGLIKGLFAGSEGEEGGLDLSKVLDILPTILDLTNVDLDLTAWDNMSFEFEDGNVDAFISGLKQIAAPLNDVVAFIAADKDIILSIGETIIDLTGYEGYKGIAPLITTLGGTAMTKEAYLAQPDNAVNNLLDMIGAPVKRIVNDPYGMLFELIPRVILYLQSDGINVLLENVTYALFKTIDIIRPIYAINLDKLLNIDLDGVTDTISGILSFLNGEWGEVIGVVLDVDFALSDIFNDVSENMENRDAMTIVLRFLLGQLVFNGNATKLAKFARTAFNLSDAQYVFLFSLLYAIKYSQIDPDGMLSVFYYIFFGAVQAEGAGVNAFKLYKYDWAKAIKEVMENLIGLGDDLGEDAQGAIDSGIGAIDTTLTGLDQIKATIALVGESWKDVFVDLPNIPEFDKDALKGLDYEYIKNQLIKEVIEEYDDFAEDHDIPGSDDVKQFVSIFQVIKDFFAKIIDSIKKLFGM